MASLEAHQLIQDVDVILEKDAPTESARKRLGHRPKGKKPVPVGHPHLLPAHFDQMALHVHGDVTHAGTHPKFTAPEQMVRTSSTVESGALGGFSSCASGRFSPG